MIVRITNSKLKFFLTQAKLEALVCTWFPTESKH